ncbi:exodeoxyribonuclease VII large subunit [bacterium]|nr:exodeoxyribonuclease VII large subunit [bacterium]
MNGRRRTIHSVRSLVAAARRALEGELAKVEVRGEIASVTRPASGHLYLTLKDADAQIRAMMFRTTARFLAFSPEAGMEVIAAGRVSVYEPRGEMQLLIERMETAGAGALAVAFEKLKGDLAARGLFDSANKIDVPRASRRVGIVTSLSAAALYDTLRTLYARQPGLSAIVAPTPVQGEGAAMSIAAVIADLDTHGACDVILLVRGGGAPEDLWSFNETAVVEAVAACVTPIVVGVGHETDFTLAELAADLRAATPTAAAQAVVADGRDQIASVRRATTLLTRALHRRIADHARRFDGAHAALARAIADRLASRRRAIARASDRLRLLDPRRRVREQRRALETHRRSLAAAMRRRLEIERGRRARADERLRTQSTRRWVRLRERAQYLDRRLAAVSPLAILARGYAIITDRAGAVVRAAGDVNVGDELSARLSRGAIDVTVRKTRNGGKGSG